jgi:hypothetical protein
MPIVLLDVAIAFVVERVFAKAENVHHAIVELFGAAQVSDGNIDMVDANGFDVHGWVSVILVRASLRRLLQAT